jgi:hypothetical protein
MQIPTIQLKVQPIARKCLHEPQHGFSEESIESEVRTALVQYAQHRGPKHECHKLARPLNSMLDVGCGKELKRAGCPAGVGGEDPRRGAGELEPEDGAEEVEGEGGPDEGLLSWV